MNSESHNLKKKWQAPELIVILDMYFNENMTDNHNHDEIAKSLGRYNSNTRSFNDGAVNQKLAEIQGLLDPSRVGRHPGRRLIDLVEKYGKNKSELRRDAIEAWREIIGKTHCIVPKFVQDILTQTCNSQF